jgi:hypothetical protein
MDWSIVAFAVFLAIMFTLVGLGLFGWRRPGAGVDEAVVGSAVFFFLLLFLAIWAVSVWLTPYGPMMYDVRWVSMLILGVIVFLFIVALTASSSPAIPPAERPIDRTEAEMAAGVGLAFWFLMVVLLAVAVAGTV